MMTISILKLPLMVEYIYIGCFDQVVCDAIIAIIFYSYSMSLQTKANQFLYNLLELTQRRKFARVIRICEFLESQGISSHEFVVIKSYAMAHSRGYAEAIRYLQPFQGALINAARIQYQQALQMFRQTEGLFDSLTLAQGESALQQLRINNQILGGNREQDIRDCLGEEENIRHRFVVNKREEEIVAKINSVSSAYEQQKRLFHQNAITKQEMDHRCSEFISAYRDILSVHHPRGKLKQLIDHYITYLSGLIQSTSQ